MAGIDRAYVTLALVLMIAGELLGFYMGMMSDLTLLTVHTTLMLVGFVTLTLFGFLYRLWPELKSGKLAVVQFWLAVVGVVGICIGTYQFVTTGGIAIVAPASALLILATLLLLWMFWTRSKA